MEDPREGPSHKEERQFDVHAGRNAFRRQISERAAQMMGKQIEIMDVDELRRQQFAIKSFTESVEEDLEEDWQRRHSTTIKDEYDSGMKESSTDETIIEVSKHNVDPTKGETQKYTMRVSGPELVDQEFELHKSLVHSASGTEFVEDEEIETQVSSSIFTLPSKTHDITNTNIVNNVNNKSSVKKSSSTAIRGKEEEASASSSMITRPRSSTTEEYPTNFAPRPRNASPRPRLSLTPKFDSNTPFEIETTKLEQTNDSFANVEKIRVVLPPKCKNLKSSQRRYSTGTKELSCASPTMTRLRCDSTAAAYHYPQPGEDIIESIPEYARKAPKKPVIHRRQSRGDDWENFPEEEQQQPQSHGDTEDESGAMENFELAKQLQQQVHRLIDEVDQHRQQLDQEDTVVSQQIMDSSNISNIQLPPLSDSSCENTFETPAQFTSEHFASALQNNQESNAPIRNAPTSQMSEEIVESREEAHWSTKMEFASESNKATIKEAGNPFSEESFAQPYEASQSNWGNTEATESSQLQYEADSSNLFYTNGTVGQQEYQQQYQQEGGYYYGNEATNNAAYASESYASTYQGYSIPSTYEAGGYYPTEYGVNTVPPPSFDAYQYDYNYGGEYATDSTIQQQMPVAAPYSGLNPFNDDGSSLPYQTDLPPQPDQTEEFPVDVSVYGSPPRAPPLPPPPAITAGLGLLAFTQKTRKHDPFSWEAQESEIEQHGAPLPPRQEKPPPRTSENTIQNETKQTEVETSKRVEPPARPKIPPPSRPPAPAAKIPSSPPSDASPSTVPRKSVDEEGKTKMEEEKQEDEEDPWARFNKMTEQVNKAVKNTGERLGQLGEQSAATQLQDDHQVQSYLSNVSGTAMQLNALQRQQILEQEANHKKLKADKRQKKLEKIEKGFGSKIGGVLAAGISAGKEVASVAKGKEKKRKEKKIEEKYDPKMEKDMEKAATDLAKKIAAQHGFKLDNEEEGEDENKLEEVKNEDNEDKNEESDESEVSIEETKIEQTDEAKQVNEAKEAEFQPPSKNWAAAFESASLLPPSESDVHLAEVLTSGITDPFDTSRAKHLALGGDVGGELDPFAPLPRQEQQESAIDDPFDVRPIEELIAEARQQAEMERSRREAEEAEGIRRPTSSRLSTPTQEGGSPVTPSMARPVGFEDDFKNMTIDEETPLYDEDDSQPLSEFPPRFSGEGWELMLRYPPKKKLMADRSWKPIFVRLNGNMISLYANAQENRPSQEILLQANYSLSDPTLQAYDIYGKIHTVKLQHILYKERVGIRPGQISRLVEGHITKYGLPLEHAAQCNVIAKFGSLDASTILSFTRAVEDALFICTCKREFTAANAPLYRQDEVQIHCYDEYEARIDREGFVHDQKARVRLFCLAFLTGTTPTLEIGLNDRRREGKEIVRRKDILPMYTERWIRFESPEFHNTVEKSVWEEDQVVRLVPPDGCFFELMRFRIRPPKNREKPLSVKCVMRLSGKQVEIRIEAAAALHQQCAKGTVESTRSIPCENICIRFPIPEAWIYIFREERHWGVGSVHSKMRKPGKVKNLKDKLMGTVQQNEPCLIEVGTGEAKYEHLFRSLVWRIPRLPDKQSAAYKSYMLKCRFTLTSFDLMPESFMPQSELEFTMPLAVVSNTVARSVGVEQHEDSDRVEKFVRYLAKFHYRVDNDYVQCPDLDVEDVVAEQPQSTTEEEQQEEVDPVTNEPYGGYRIELPDDNIHQQTQIPSTTPKDWKENGGEDIKRKLSKSSSSSGSSDSGRKAFPVIQIDMKGYGY